MSIFRGMYQVEHEKEQKREERENREKVLVPVRSREAIDEEEKLEKRAEKVWKIPRRWRV